MDKTNVMRLLEAADIKYNSYNYDITETDGMNVAKLLNKDPEQVFKTLVTVSNTLEHYIFVIPVKYTLDLKKAAKTAKVKSIEMIKQKDLLPLTGYIHGGCSPIGMKKTYKTFINDTAILFDTIIFSGGKIGYQVEVDPIKLCDYINGEFSEVIVSD